MSYAFLYINLFLLAILVKNGFFYSFRCVVNRLGFPVYKSHTFTQLGHDVYDFVFFIFSAACAVYYLNGIGLCRECDCVIKFCNGTICLSGCNRYCLNCLFDSCSLCACYGNWSSIFCTACCRFCAVSCIVNIRTLSCKRYSLIFRICS